MNLQRVVIGSLVFCLATAGIPSLGFTDSRSVVLEATGHRPVADAVKDLQRRLGVVVTYEDPAFFAGPDLEDVTHRLPAAEALAESEGGPRVFVPRTGSIEILYSVDSVTGLSADLGQVLEDLIQDQAARSNPGRFRWEANGASFHVIPTHVTGKNGSLITQPAPLSRAVTLSLESRTGLDSLQATLNALAVETSLDFSLGLVPAKPLIAATVTVGGRSRVARELLGEILWQIDPMASWQLLWDATSERFFLNVEFVRQGVELQHRGPARSTLLGGPFSN